MKDFTRPNVLLLYTDQQRWDTIKAAGFDYMITPNLDKLAKEGVLFTNAFCNNPVCMPSRQSMLSGMYPSKIGCTCNGIEFPEGLHHLATIIKPYGYITANIGKLHFLNHSNRDHTIPHPSYGFDIMINSDEPGCYNDAYIKWVEYVAPEEIENCKCDTPPAVQHNKRQVQPRETVTPYVFKGPEKLTHTAFVASETIRFLKENFKRQFLCICGFYAPHPPLCPPARFIEMYDNISIPSPKMKENENKWNLSIEKWKEIRKYYYAMVTHIDDQIGRIIQTLEDLGIRNKTLIIFLSDHGEHLGDHGLIQKGPPGYDSCMHIPLIVSWPNNVISGVSKKELIESVDIMPTILDLCGIQIPPWCQGRSFASLLLGKGYKERDSVFMEYKTPAVSWKGIRTHNYKYLINDKKHELLFDLSIDPYELNNLADDPGYLETLKEMRFKLLTRWFDVENRFLNKTAEY